MTDRKVSPTEGEIERDVTVEEGQVDAPDAPTLSLKKRARRAKTPFTPEKQIEFIELYSRGGTVKQAAAAVGVSFVTVFRKIKADEHFAEMYRLAMDLNTDQLEDLLHTHATKGNIAALFGTLKARRPEKWRDNVRMEHAGKIEFTTADALQAARERAKLRDVPEVTH
jgi:hypothetical protein